MRTWIVTLVALVAINGLAIYAIYRFTDAVADGVVDKALDLLESED
jgi:hypothetical protein